MTEKQHDTGQLFQTAPVLKTILDALPVGVVIFDHDARIFYANEYAEQLFGKKPSEPDDLKCGDFIGCRHRFLDAAGCGHSPVCPDCPLFRAIGAAISPDSKTGIRGGETLIERESGNGAIWIKYKIDSLFLDGGNVAVLAVEDISDQKHLSLQQWSSLTLKEFCRAEGKGLHYPIEQAGVWATLRESLWTSRPTKRVVEFRMAELR
ncbi:MAG: PAS domain-containing protein [Desulfatiglandaceae bacterium]